MPNRFFRRQYIINPEFQILWSLLLSVVAAFASSVFAVPLLETIERENTLLRQTIRDDQRLFETSQDITILLMNLPETRQETSERAGAAFDEAYARHEVMKERTLEMIETNETQKVLVITSVPVIAMALFFVGLLLTHSVAGPLYVIKRQLETYGQTRQIDERALRRGDAFLDVYATLYRVLGKEDPPSTSV